MACSTRFAVFTVSLRSPFLIASLIRLLLLKINLSTLSELKFSSGNTLRCQLEKLVNNNACSISIILCIKFLFAKWCKPREWRVPLFPNMKEVCFQSKHHISSFVVVVVFDNLQVTQ